MTITKLDLSGLKCPLPALKTRRALKSLAPGDRLEVRCTDPLAAIDIPHLVASTGDRLEAIERGERDIVFRIEKSASQPSGWRRRSSIRNTCSPGR
jgi:tRNA 2-thiouridine synthesizing protein A